MHVERARAFIAQVAAADAPYKARIRMHGPASAMQRGELAADAGGAL